MGYKFQQWEPQNVVTEQLNLTGIPTQMKLNFEQRSGMSFDDVRVHYNSDKPAQFHALAYTQGTQIYVGPGQERSLPHELGHVIQQKAGRVRPTRWIRGQPVNDQPELEREADRSPVQCMPAPALRGVIQMDWHYMPPQRGSNCGYHALARAIYALSGNLFNDLPEDNNLEIQLTRYAIEHGYSAIGEAFDPYALMQVGNEFLSNPDNNRGVSIECEVVDIDELNVDPILKRAKNGEIYILVPYFEDKNTLEPAKNENKEENAHWSVFAVSSYKKGSDVQGDLYEGNFYGTTCVDDTDPQQNVNVPPLKEVSLEDLRASNASINTSFSWLKFLTDNVLNQASFRAASYKLVEPIVRKKALGTETEIPPELDWITTPVDEALKQINKSRESAMGTKKPFSSYNDLYQQLHLAKGQTEKISQKDDPLRQDVSLAGRVVIVRKENQTGSWCSIQ